MISCRADLLEKLKTRQVPSSITFWSQDNYIYTHGLQSWDEENEGFKLLHDDIIDYLIRLDFIHESDGSGAWKRQNIALLENTRAALIEAFSVFLNKKGIKFRVDRVHDDSSDARVFVIFYINEKPLNKTADILEKLKLKNDFPIKSDAALGRITDLDNTQHLCAVIPLTLTQRYFFKIVNPQDIALPEIGMKIYVHYNPERKQAKYIRSL